MLLQIPGGPELLVIMLVMLLLFGIPLVLVVVLGGLYLRGNSGTDDDVSERIAELEAEIAALRTELGDDGVTESRDVSAASGRSSSGGDDVATDDVTDDDRLTNDDVTDDGRGA